jgi:phenylalanyl-tRNA synthetase beta chain
MNVSWKWIGDFVDLDGIDPLEAAERLTMSGLEVAGVKPLCDPALARIVTAQITTLEKHPQADKLSLCTVFDGRENFSIICGARNMKAGDKVAMAPVGTRFPNGLTIKKAKIRGIASTGMLCSAAEMGLEEESSGIIILPESAPLGIPVIQCLELDDQILEIEITPNRGDCLSVIGVAREIAALYQRPFSYPTPVFDESGPQAAELVKIKILDSELCPRYVGRIAEQIVIADSPAWMKQRLQAAGVRSINNVVDITNYVMLETGQPLHAFDLDMVGGRRIIVRTAGSDKTFVTLDEVERTLDPETLMICDGSGPVAVAGIMGGLNSEITENTRNVLIESAFFQPASIRRSARLLGLATESSYRFERGVDPGGSGLAADRAIELLEQLAQARIAANRIDVNPRPHKPGTASIRTGYTNRLLGIKLEPADIKNILERLQFELVETDGASFTVRAPSYRFDIEREADLIEEVARIYGYNKIPTTLPVIREQGGAGFDDERLPRLLKSMAVAYGYSEAINYSFMDPSALEQLNLPEGDRRRQFVRLINPLTEELSVMRTSLVPALLNNLVDNYRVFHRDIRLFEYGKVFLPRAGKPQPNEPYYLAGVATGRRCPLHFDHPDAMVDFYDLKGLLENIAAACRITFSYTTEKMESYLHPGRAAAILLEGQVVGSFGQLHPDLAEQLDISQDIFIFELQVEPLQSAAGFRPTFQSIPRYPASYRDLAVVIDDNVSAGELVDAIRQTSKLITAVEIFDIYKGSQIPADKKSIALKITFQDMNKTLTDKKVNAIIEKIGKRIKHDFNGQIR